MQIDGLRALRYEIGPLRISHKIYIVLNMSLISFILTKPLTRDDDVLLLLQEDTGKK